MIGSAESFLLAWRQNKGNKWVSLEEKQDGPEATTTDEIP